MSKKKTLDEFKKDLYRVWGDKYTVSPNAVYVSTHDKLMLVCSKHGEFLAEPNSILHGHGCKECRSETVGKNRTLSQENVIKRLKKVWGDKYDLSKIKYINARTKITPICRLHGEFKIRFSDFENLHGCPICNESRLENEIRMLLIENNIKFEREYKNEWLKNGSGCLKIDFYLPEYNIAVECQGQQHYTRNGKYALNGNFEKNIERDKRKFELCKINNVTMLYFTDKKLKYLIPEEYKNITYYDKYKLLSVIQKNKQKEQ